MPKVWVVRADGGALTDAFVAGGYASIGWNIEIDLSEVHSRDELEDLYRNEHSPPENKHKAGQEIGQLHTFLNAIEAGDWIITPSDKTAVLRYGEVKSRSLYFVEGGDRENPQPNRRKVRWLRSPLIRQELSVQFQHSLRAQRTVFSLERHGAEFFEKIGKPELGSPVARVDSDYKAIAIDRLLQLDPYEFEELVGTLLEAMGFEEVKVTKRSGDGGVDVIGILHASTLADIRLFVQVKRYQRNRKINKAEVRALRAGIPHNGKGAFVTTASFAKGVIDVAREDNFPDIGLTDGEQLIDLLLEHWADIPDRFQDLLGLQPGLVLS